MRTYSNGTKAKKTGKHFLKKNVYAVVLGGALLITALVITLTLTLGIKKPTNDSPDVPTVTPPVTDTVFVSPLKECVLKTDAALNSLVWNETLRQWRTHNGVDFAANVGDEAYCISDGKVTKVETTILDGLVVTVTHADGYVSVYKGLDSASVEADADVKAGDTLGKIGNMMCEQNRGAHLHLEMQKDGKYVSVMDHLNLNEDK